MSIIRKIAASFTMYSKIPVPFIRFEDKDYENIIAFLPLTGLVIAVIMYVVRYLAVLAAFPETVTICALILVPLIITGGFHVDGFLDTADALASYRSVEEKRRILKDPHVGSFAVIGLVICGLFSLVGLGLLTHVEALQGLRLYPVICTVFIISRCGAGLTSVYIKKANDEGMLAKEAKNAGSPVKIFLFIQLVAAYVYVAYTDIWAAITLIGAYIFFTLIYRSMVLKNFGGVSGDTAGYYVTVSEVFAICVIAGLYTLRWLT